MERETKRMIRIEEYFEEIGLSEFSQEELDILRNQLKEAIQIGITRDGPPIQEDKGLLAIRTGVEPVTSEDWDRVPNGTSVIACAYAGSNWLTSIVRKSEDGSPETVAKVLSEIPEDKREMKFQDLIALMCDQIKSLREYITSEEIVAVALGFAHLNKITDYGVDAQFIRQDPAKFWFIVDYDKNVSPDKQPYIGESIVTYLKSLGLEQINSYYILNDTNSVASNVLARRSGEGYEFLPVGFVFGTGDNASLKDTNLEAGKAKILEPDAITLKMADENLLPVTRENLKKDCIVEFWMGGDFIRYRLACALLLLGEQELIKNSNDISEAIIRSKDSAILSEIASEKLESHELSEILKVEVAEEDLSIIAECAQLVIKKASQLMAVMISGVVEAAGYKGEKADIPIEGSVYWDGYKVNEEVEKSLNILLPGNKLEPTKAVGYVGIAQLAMVMANKKGLLDNRKQ
jgi:hexokinase